MKAAEAARNEAEVAWDEAIKAIPNPAADEAPAGGEDDFVVLEHVGTPREFDFEPRDHIELGRMLGAIDLERGAKVSAARGSTSSPASAPSSSSRWSTWRWTRPATPASPR